MPKLRRTALAALMCLAMLAPLPARAAEAPAPSPIGEVHASPPPVLSSDEPAVPDMSSYALRHGQLQLHQGLGLAALVSMAITAGIGYDEADLNPSQNLLDAHFLMAGLTTGLYLSAATLAILAPPPPIQEETSFWDTSSLHKDLAWLHGAGIVSTIALGLATNYLSSKYRDYHAVAAYSTLGLMALSAGVIAFGE